MFFFVSALHHSAVVHYVRWTPFVHIHRIHLLKLCSIYTVVLTIDIVFLFLLPLAILVIFLYIKKYGSTSYLTVADLGGGARWAIAPPLLLGRHFVFYS